MNTSAQINPQNLERLRLLRYIDDDFSCTDPDDMNYEVLAKRARYFKQEKEGVAAMSRVFEDIKKEAARETAERMIRMGKLSLEEIALYVPLLSLEELKDLEAEIMQLV